jgi:large conductance mechanosensitive channel
VRQAVFALVKAPPETTGWQTARQERQRLVLFASLRRHWVVLNYSSSICTPGIVPRPSDVFDLSQGAAMSIASEFKEFALKGNVMDLAVGIIIGAAFGKIVDSAVNDLIMPLIGKVTGGLDFSSYYIGLNGQPSGLPLAEAKKAGAVFAYGSFITVVLYFIILAFIIFVMVKQMNKLKRQAPATPETTPEDVLLLRQIRDSLQR